MRGCIQYENRAGANSGLTQPDRLETLRKIRSKSETLVEENEKSLLKSKKRGNCKASLPGLKVFCRSSANRVAGQPVGGGYGASGSCVPGGLVGGASWRGWLMMPQAIVRGAWNCPH